MNNWAETLKRAYLPVYVVNASMQSPYKYLFAGLNLILTPELLKQAADSEQAIEQY